MYCCDGTEAGIEMLPFWLRRVHPEPVRSVTSCALPDATKTEKAKDHLMTARRLGQEDLQDM
jgi:hypothetical protein